MSSAKDTEEDAFPRRADCRLQPGHRVGGPHGAVVLQLIARGGFGEVYAASHPTFGACAVKVLREDKDTPVRQRALLDEAATLRALPRHPAFIQVFESGFDPAIGTPYLTMELLGGRTLRAELSAREHAFHPSEVTTAGVVLAGALAELHERGFTHADVAPTNVFVVATHTALSASGLRLIDVGAVASVTQPGSELRGIGTPHYLAPERRHGPATPAGDMFALGVVLFEMATKEHPFDRSAPRGRAPALRLLAPHASELLERAIAWMLELDPRRRPRSGRDVLSLLTTPGPLSQRGAESVEFFPRALRAEVDVASNTPAAVGPATTAFPTQVPFTPTDKLVVVEGAPELVGFEVRLDKPFVHVGRSAECDVVLDHPSVSRRHCSIGWVCPGTYEINDLGSRLGTCSYCGDGPSFISRVGNKIWIGDLLLRIEPVDG